MSTVDENIEVSITPNVKTVPGKLGTVITEKEYNTLEGMLKSRDVGDHRMAQAILNQCDIGKSIYWIWKLAKTGYSSNMVYLRTKASREFVRDTNLWKICRKDSTEFARYLKEKNWLTLEIFQYLKVGIFKELIARIQYNNVHEVHVTIKDEYREFDPDSTLTHLSTKKDD